MTDNEASYTIKAPISGAALRYVNALTVAAVRSEQRGTTWQPKRPRPVSARREWADYNKARACVDLGVPPYCPWIGQPLAEIIRRLRIEKDIGQGAPLPRNWLASTFGTLRGPYATGGPVSLAMRNTHESNGWMGLRRVPPGPLFSENNPPAQTWPVINVTVEAPWGVGVANPDSVEAPEYVGGRRAGKVMSRVAYLREKYEASLRFAELSGRWNEVEQYKILLRTLEEMVQTDGNCAC